MHLAKVVGQVVCTRKDPLLAGVRLLLVQPVNTHQEPQGRTMVAADGIQSRTGEVVVCVRAREASLALAERKIPSDLSIVAKVDAVGA